MGLRPVKGNMYSFCTHTFNTIKGICPHQCRYCYMKKFKLNPVRLDRKEFDSDLGENNFIFWGSSCDTFARGIPKDWIIESLKFLSSFENKYLIQTKNPSRILDLKNYLPVDVVIGTTIETNRSYNAMGLAPDTASRAMAMKRLANLGYKTMVTIEPIMDFDVDMLTLLIQACKPEWVNIGADSKGHDLCEPSRRKVLQLIDALTASWIQVNQKTNLGRILNEQRR